MTGRYACLALGFVAAGMVGVAAQRARTPALGATRNMLRTPRGAFEIVSDGVGVISADDAAPIGVLHVRVAIDNHNARAWSLDVSRARLQTPTSTIAPLFARAAATSLPIVMVDRGERAVVELYFPAPDAKAALSSLALAWPLNAPREMVAEGRIVREGDPGPAPIARSRWWANPTHPWPTFARRSGPIRSRPPRSIVIVSAPTWQLTRLSSAGSDGGDETAPPVNHECDEW